VCAKFLRKHQFSACTGLSLRAAQTLTEKWRTGRAGLAEQPGAPLGCPETIVHPAEIRHDVVVIRGQTRCAVTKSAGDAVDPHPNPKTGRVLALVLRRHYRVVRDGEGLLYRLQHAFDVGCCRLQCVIAARYDVEEPRRLS
jgi:hypothetical protein